MTTAAPARWATPRTAARPSYGAAIGKLAAAMGTPLMPWQRHVVDVGTELNPDGSWAYRIVVVTVQRQAGKTTLLGPKIAHRCLTKTDARCWLTAQRRQDARDIWADVAQRVSRSPLASRVKVRRSNGSESLTFPTGSTFRVFAPTEDALHGKANECVDVDEAWAFDAAQGAALEQAILPSFTTTGGQLWIVSTAGTAESAWLREHVERGRAAVEADRRDTVAYFEWSLADDAVAVVTRGLEAAASDADRAAAFAAVLDAHPAAGRTLRVDALEQAASSMSPGDFLRAFGNRWTRTADRVIADHAWAAVLAPTWPPPPGQVALAFDVAVDRSDAAIVAAWRDTDTGPIRVDVVEAHPGTGWLADRVAALAARWRPLAIGHDQAGPAGDVADELRRRGVELVSTTAREYAAACASFLAAVTDRRVEHRGQDALDDAVAAAAQRPLGDAWAWSRRGSAGSIAPLVAATLAAWAFDHKPAPAARPVVAVARRRRVA